MKKQQHTSKTETPKVSEPETVYQTSRDVDKWNPTKPFHGTQEEWWEHFREIEKGEFTPVKEAHERVSQWLKEQKK